MAQVEQMTEGRVTIGPGTLYNLLDNFRLYGMIEETGSFGAAAATSSPIGGGRCCGKNMNGCKSSCETMSAA